MRTCKILFCKNPTRSSGMCPTHYARERYGHEPRELKAEDYPECKVSHCPEPSAVFEGHMLCNSHYQLSYRGVDPETRIVTGNRVRKTCSMEDCTRRSESYGLCRYHARRVRTGREEAPEGCEIPINEPCAFEGCDRPYATKKLCHSHYSQWRKDGNLKPLREYGKYISGEHVCIIQGCRRPSISSDLCERHNQMRTQYKVSAEKLIEIWTDPACENPGCNDTKRLNMDHDHVTGEFRGLLCGSCNTSLGSLKEDQERIKGLAEYVNRFQ